MRRNVKIISESKANCSSSEDDLLTARNSNSIDRIEKVMEKYPLTRPKASPGYWLCTLLPASLLVAYWSTNRQQQCLMPTNYLTISLMAVMLLFESLNFFICLAYNIQSRMYKVIPTVTLGLMATILLKCFMNYNWLIAGIWGCGVTFFYHLSYFQLLKKLPLSFTYGEASILAQGGTLFLFNAILQAYYAAIDPLFASDDFQKINLIMMVALLYLGVLCLLLNMNKFLHQPKYIYGLLVLYAICATCIPVIHQLPIVFVLQFIFKDTVRLYIVLFYMALMAATVCAVGCQLFSKTHASTSVRKVFHILLLLVYIPGLLHQCTLLYLATGVALAILTIIEILRLLNVPPFGDILLAAFQIYADEKDVGLVAFTPFSLLIGCSLPIWLLPCPCPCSCPYPCPCHHTTTTTTITSSSSVTNNTLQLLTLCSGLVTIGCGDTAASIIGSRFGKIKWRNSHRSLEGSLAFILATLIPIYLLNLCGFLQLNLLRWLLILMAALITSLIEAHTDQIDNLVLPFVFYLIVNFIPSLPTTTTTTTTTTTADML